MDVELKTINGIFDIDTINGDLVADDGLATAIFISLLTDARANTVLTPELRRGWLGNVGNDRDLGGLLWLVEQRRLTQTTLNETVDYARKSLAWLVDDGLAVNVAVSGQIVPKLGIELGIIITSPTGETESYYVKLWENTVENAN